MQIKQILINLSNLSKYSRYVNKLVPVPVDLSELCDAIKNDVVKKDPYNAKVENIEDLSLKCKILQFDWLKQRAYF